MKTILLTHAARYPLMEPTDAVKLLYQSAFGGGHLIRDEEKCLEFLKSEYASVLQNPGTPLLENIGNHFFRINLAALDAGSLTPEELGHAFIRSSRHSGSMDSFQEMLSCLMELTCAGQMPFPPEALEHYLSDYKKAGFPPVSHSETYRSAYHPAYRVVHTDCLPESVKQQMP